MFFRYTLQKTALKPHIYGHCLLRHTILLCLHFTVRGHLPVVNRSLRDDKVTNRICMCLWFPNTAGKRRPEQLIITLYDSVAKAHKARGLLVLGQVFGERCSALTARPTFIPDQYGVSHFSFFYGT